MNSAAARQDADAVAPVLVAGGGPVGSALALALGRAGIPVTLLDAATGGGDAPAELRPIALSASSERILRTLDVWPLLEPDAEPIRTVHVSERGRFGVVRLRASELGVDALGQVADAGSIARALDRSLDGCTRVRRMRPATVAAVEPGDGRARVRMASAGADLDAMLVVAADGAQSLLRESLGVAVHSREYRQHAVVCNVTPGVAHRQVAYERFTPGGPVALLPLADARCGLVWTLDENRAAEVAGCDDAGFLLLLQECFGNRLGRLQAASPRSTFALSLVRSESVTARRCVLIGNAANQLHPVAGQGLNLGLRDAAVLAEMVARAVRRGLDPGDPGLLAEYSRRRRRDQDSVVRFTDALARGFTAGPPALGVLRGAGLLALDLVPAAGRAFARRAMGLAGPQPRLVRGLLP